MRNEKAVVIKMRIRRDFNFKPSSGVRKLSFEERSWIFKEVRRSIDSWKQKDQRKL